MFSRPGPKPFRMVSTLGGFLCLLCAAPARGQGYPIRTFDGPSPSSGVGRAVANAGDVDGDGVVDFVIGGNSIARVHSGATGALVHSLAPPPFANGYGAAVAGVGDVDGDGRSDLAVGAPMTSFASLLDGQAFVHSGATGAVLLTMTGAGAEALGTSLAGPGDVNLDGVPDVVTGGHGLVKVWSGTNGSLLLSLSGFATFGRALAGVGDFNGDGVPDFAVGQPGFPFFLGPGPVTVRSGANGAILLTIPPPPTPIQLDFGVALAAAGDVNGDGVTDLIVGASQTWESPFYLSLGPGLARVYSGATAGLLFSFAGSAVGDAFGCSVAGPGDLDGDGVPDVLVGARQGTLPPASAGPGYVRAFSGATGSLLLTMAGAALGDAFGSAVAPAGDPNADGVPDFIVGAPFADPGGVSDAGRAVLASFVGLPPNGTLLGSGCPGSAGAVPAISVSGGVPNSAGNAAVAIHLSRALPGSLAITVVGLSSTSWLGVPLPISLGFLGLPACALAVSADVVLAIPTNGAGRAALPAPTPANAALSGASIFFQWYVVDPGPALVPASMTPGLQIVIV